MTSPPRWNRRRLSHENPPRSRLHFNHIHHDRAAAIKIRATDVSFWYGADQALFNIDLNIYDREVTAFLGPSGCGKTTLLRCFNRTNDIIDPVRMEGLIELEGMDINAPELDPVDVRRRFGWVAQKPNPFPSSVYKNIAYGPRIQGLVRNRQETEEIVEKSLRRARHVGRDKGSSASARHRALGRSAAAALYRQGHCHCARCHFDG